jgi:predicted nucleic acid-binding protein
VIAYFDTSAAIKLLVAESRSGDAARLWDGAEKVASSLLLYPEARAALARARRERRIGTSELRLATSGFELLWRRVERVQISTALAERAGELAHAHEMRGYDAVHLASAEALRSQTLVFVAADRALCDAARALGMNVARLHS